MELNFLCCVSLISISGSLGTGSTTFGALAAQASSSTSGQSGVKGASQEGIYRTSVDILQFTGGSAATGASTTSTPTGFAAASAPTGFAALAQMAPTKRKSFKLFVTLKKRNHEFSNLRI